MRIRETLWIQWLNDSLNPIQWINEFDPLEEWRIEHSTSLAGDYLDGIRMQKEPVQTVWSRRICLSQGEPRTFGDLQRSERNRVLRLCKGEETWQNWFDRSDEDAANKSAHSWRLKSNLIFAILTVRTPFEPQNLSSSLLLAQDHCLGKWKKQTIRLPNEQCAWIKMLTLYEPDRSEKISRLKPMNSAESHAAWRSGA